MKIGLAMLVKDEAETLPRTLPAMLEVVDNVTIIDTGSTDDTRSVLDGLIDMPALIVDRPWQGFGVNRSELLRAASGWCDYILMLDADHTLHVEGERPRLSADSYMLRIRGYEEWRLPLLTKAKHPFEYRGAAHAYLASPEPTTEADLDWLSIDGGGGVTVEKLERDRAALALAFLEDTSDPRTVFYLAQTYRDLGMVAEAIRFYRLRSEMDGWDEETYCAKVELGKLLVEKVSYNEGADVLLDAWRFRPSRAEALRALANSTNSVADKMSKPPDRLFVRPSAYGKDQG